MNATVSPRPLRKALLGLAASVLLVGAILFGLRALGLEEASLALLERLREAGPLGAFVLGLCIVVFVPAVLPSAPLTFGAGLLYGPFAGATLVVVSTTVGALISLLLARRVLVRAVKFAISNRPRIRTLLALPGEDDWRLVAMLRVIPFFPFKLSNYALGLTPLSTRAFALGTFVGLWPIALVNAWIGSLAGDIALLGTAARPHDAFGWTLQIGGLLACAVLTLVLVRRATRAVDAALAREQLPSNGSR